MAVDLAVIIVTWNVRDVVLDALSSLLDDLHSGHLTADVYIVDSASIDGTADAIETRFPQVKVIRSGENLGFAGANNLALRQIGFGTAELELLPRAVYLLNPDTITQRGATEALYTALNSDPKVGLVGASLTYGDGSFQDGAFSFPGLRQLWAEFFPTPGRFILGRFNGRYPRKWYAAAQPFAVDFVLGATMMLKREVITQTGLFDEQFFMYCEEIDWAWRIHDAGWRVWCIPSAHIIHLGGQSTSQIRPQSLINLWKSRLLLFDKHYTPVKRILARWMVSLGMKFKLRRLSRSDDLSPQDRSALAEAFNTIREMASS